MTETGIGFEFVHEAHFSADRTLMIPLLYGKVLDNIDISLWATE